MKINAIGMIEFNSIAQGIESTDEMCKAANITLLVSKTICPGKYMSIVCGETDDVKRAIEVGEDKGPECLNDSFMIPNIHEALIPAIASTTPLGEVRAIGILETFSVATLIEAADLALKMGNVVPIRLHMAFGIGGKAYIVLSGETAAVRAAIEEGSRFAEEKGQLVRKIVIPKPHPMLVETLL